MGEPGILALRIAARRLLPGRDRFVASDFARQVRRDLANPDAAHHRQIGIELARQQRLDFARPRRARSCGRSARRSARRAICAAAAGSAVEARPRRRCRLRAAPAIRASVRPVDRITSSARAIRAVSAGLSRAAASGSSSLEPRAIVLDTRVSRRARALRVDLRDRRDAVEQGAQIKAGPAGEDRQSALAWISAISRRAIAPSPPPSRATEPSSTPYSRCSARRARRGVGAALSTGRSR